MRILFATPYVPSRIRVRPFNLIKSLATRHEISLVSLVVDDYERAMVRDIEEYCASIDLIPLSKWQSYARCLLALPTLEPLRVAYYRSAAFAQRIKEVIRREKIDVAHGELIKVAPALRSVLVYEHIPALFDSVDCVSWFLQQQMETARNPLKKAFVFSELLKMRRYERVALAGFDQVIVTSANDRHRLQQLAGRSDRAEVVGNGVDTDYFSPTPGSRERDSLVFCAKLDYQPNVQAILHFVENVLPLVWCEHPQARLAIVGNKPPKAVRALATEARITVTGYVPDTRPYLGTASVAIAPLMIAAGVQNKVLEALAMGTPTVTTSRCARAIGLEDSVHLLVADDAQAFAKAILRLLDEPALAGQLSQSGRKLVTEHFSWTHAATTLEGLYESIVRKSPQLAVEANHVLVSRR
jgi:sugar transferase (PEP-CTERM/EpsH1 system associated)